MLKPGRDRTDDVFRSMEVRVAEGGKNITFRSALRQSQRDRRSESVSSAAFLRYDFARSVETAEDEEAQESYR
jgi:hypothetical protein